MATTRPNLERRNPDTSPAARRPGQPSGVDFGGPRLRFSGSPCPSTCPPKRRSPVQVSTGRRHSRRRRMLRLTRRAHRSCENMQPGGRRLLRHLGMLRPRIPTPKGCPVQALWARLEPHQDAGARRSHPLCSRLRTRIECGMVAGDAVEVNIRPGLAAATRLSVLVFRQKKRTSRPRLPRRLRRAHPRSRTGCSGRARRWSTGSSSDEETVSSCTVVK